MAVEPIDMLAGMTLVQSAKLNCLDPYAYLRDILTRLPTNLNSYIEELLPHNWKPRVAESANDSAQLTASRTRYRQTIKVSWPFANN